jgi:hypothetical protein
VHLASGIPCALFYWAYEKFQHTSGAWRREIAETRLLLPSHPRAKRAAGGVGGGGCFSKFASGVTRGDTPPPTSPRRACWRRGEGDYRFIKLSA